MKINGMGMSFNSDYMCFGYRKPKAENQIETKKKNDGEMSFSDYLMRELERSEMRCK